MGAMKYFRHILMGHEMFFKIFDGPHHLLDAVFLILVSGTICLVFFFRCFNSNNMVFEYVEIQLNFCPFLFKTT